jgi:HEAT repeat protein
MTTADDPLPDLMADTRHRTPSVRLSAVRALGRLGWLARDALPALTEALNDGEAKVREAAAAAVGQVGPDAVPALARMLRHPDKYVRRNAVWGLGKLGPLAKAVLPDLCRTLADVDPRTASGAAQALGSMGAEGADAIPALTEAMRGTNIVLCRLAAKALSQIGRPALPTLVTHLKHHDPFVRGEAAVALGWMGPAAAPAVPHLVDVLRARPAARPRPSALSPGPGAATPVTPIALTSGDPQPTEDGCRAGAAQALGRIGPPAADAIPALQLALTDPSAAVRQAAEVALRQVRGE